MTACCCECGASWNLTRQEKPLRSGERLSHCQRASAVALFRWVIGGNIGAAQTKTFSWGISTEVATQIRRATSAFIIFFPFLEILELKAFHACSGCAACGVFPTNREWRGTVPCFVVFLLWGGCKLRENVTVKIANVVARTAVGLSRTWERLLLQLEVLVPGRAFAGFRAQEMS